MNEFEMQIPMETRARFSWDIPQLITALAGLVWGGTTAFAMALESPVFSTLYIQGFGLLFGVLLVTAAFPVVWVAGFRTWPGTLILLHALGACFSSLVMGSSPTSVGRFVLLVPAVVVFAGLAKEKPKLLAALRVGLTLGGLMLVYSVLSAADLRELLNPAYRYWAFLNPNGVAFIAAMCAISVLDYAYRAFRSGIAGLPMMLVYAALFVCCSLIMLATKSRTATLALMMGVAAYLFCKLGTGRIVISSVVVLFLAGAATVYVNIEAGAGRLSDAFSLEGGARAVEAGSGRFQGWAIIMKDIWMPNPVFGLGPDEASVQIESESGISSAHNGILRNLVDVGLLGTWPLLVWVVAALWRGWVARRRVEWAIVIALMIGGLVESGAETMFFSIGNPGSLLFLLGVSAALVFPTRDSNTQLQQDAENRAAASVDDTTEGAFAIRGRS